MMDELPKHPGFAIVAPLMRQCLACLCALLSFVLLAPADAQAQVADLALAKAVSNPTPTVGSTITFTITLTNLGSDTANVVGVTDPLPAGLTFVSATPSQGTYTPATGLWTVVGAINTGASQTLAIVATVVGPGAMSNTATIAFSDQFDSDIANNTATVTVTPQQADLALAKIVSNATPTVGDTITFTITLTNAGPDTAPGVAVTDLLPAGLTFVSATPSQGTYTPATGLWTVGTITTGTPQTLAIVATVAGASAMSNTATISDSDQFDSNTSNNSATVTVTPQAAGAADLALAKTVSNATPTVGSTVTFTITLTNAGPDTATGVAVTELLPAGLTFVSATPSQGTYTPATGLWTVGTITTGTPQTLAIVATVAGASAMSNTATISDSDQSDTNTSNNSATVTVTPPAAGAADLALAKTVSNATPTVGSTITFTITLTNAGPDTATGVAVTDLLPAGLTFVSATPSQGTYTPATGVWSVGTITTGTPQTLAIVATVTGSSAMSNTVTITASDQADPVAGNNTATVTVTPPAAVPTLPSAALIFLMGTLAVLAVRSLRMRRDAGRA
jgi:uncharacterized repeat protein (TIGR01451 family)